MNTDLNQYIELRPKLNGAMRPFIAGTRVEVQYIVKDHDWQGIAPEEIAQGLNVSLAHVYAALAYYHANREEVRAMMREDQQYVDSLRAASTKQIRLEGIADVGSPTVPS